MKGLIIIFCVILILIYVYLLAQWENGATLWESLAPNEPIMATIWLIVLGFVFFLVVAKFGEDHDNKKTAVNRGLVRPDATAKEAKEALRIAEVDRQNWIFRRNQKWQYSDKVMSMLRNRIDEFYKLQFITDEQKERAMEVLRKYGEEWKRIGDEIRREKGVSFNKFDDWALSTEMRKTPDYNDYKDLYKKLGLDFLKGEISRKGWLVTLTRNGKVIKEVVQNNYGVVIGTREEWEERGMKF